MPHKISSHQVREHALGALEEWMAGYTQTSAHPQYRVTSLTGDEEDEKSALVFKFTPANLDGDYAPDAIGTFLITVGIRRLPCHHWNGSRTG